MIMTVLGLETRLEGGKREQTKIQSIAMIQEICDIVLDKDGISRGVEIYTEDWNNRIC